MRLGVLCFSSRITINSLLPKTKTRDSICVAKMLNPKGIAMIAVLVSILLSALQTDTPIHGNNFVLGVGQYDMKALSAPVVKSQLLQIFAWLLTRTRLGPLLRRVLLNGNGIVNVREMAALVDLPPMYYPVRRVSKALLYAFDEQSAQQLSSLLNSTVDSVSMEGHSRSVSDYAKFYAQGNKPSDVMKALLKTIKEWEGQDFRVFASVIDQDVLEQAYQSDKRHAIGRPLSVFDGVPVAFKDMVSIDKHIMYNGKHPKRGDWVTSSKDDIMVARFRNLGAIILGSTIMTEGGTSPLGYSSHFKGPFNPYALDRYSGGSSSGSAVAVACGLVPIAIGFDGGGSIRIPAAMSGVHGLAATFSRIPFDKAHESTMIKAGPFANSAHDVALAYAALSPNAQGNFYTSLYDGEVHGPPAPHLTGVDDTADLSDVRLGVFAEWFNDSDTPVRARAWEVVEFLRSRGARVVEISIPHLQTLSLSHAMTISSEFALTWDLTHHDGTYGAYMEANTRITVGIGSSVSALEVLAAATNRAWAFKYVTELFAREDLTAIVTPTVGLLPPMLDDDTQVAGESNTELTVKVMKHVFLANLLGLPAYSVPVGFLAAAEGAGSSAAHMPEGVQGKKEKEKLPVGVQLLGDHWQEHKLIRLAKAIESGFTKKLKVMGNREDNLFHRPLKLFDPFAYANHRDFA